MTRTPKTAKKKAKPAKSPNQRMYGLVPSVDDRIRDARASVIIASAALSAGADEGDSVTLPWHVADSIRRALDESGESLYWIVANVDADVLHTPAPTDDQLRQIGGVNPWEKREASGGAK